MICSCIANDNFNFIIEYKKDYLLFIDKSDWNTSSYNTPLAEFPLQIINGNKSTTISAKVNGSTIIKYCDLPSDNGCGNDGIYQFKLESCGQEFSKYEAILINIMCAYTKLLITKDFSEYDKVIWPIYREIEFIKANAIMGLETKAKEHYNIVKKMLEHINCKC